MIIDLDSYLITKILKIRYLRSASGWSKDSGSVAGHAGHGIVVNLSIHLVSAICDCLAFRFFESGEKNGACR